MYESNYTVLRQVIADKSVIRHVSQHRGPDGSFDLDGNKKIWNSALSRFDQIPLWENGAPGYDGRDPPAATALTCFHSRTRRQWTTQYDHCGTWRRV